MAAPKKTPEEEMQQHYKNVFGTPEGRAVLGDILFSLCHFGAILDPDNPARIGEYNVGIAIARTARAFDLIYPQLGIKGE